MKKYLLPFFLLPLCAAAQPATFQTGVYNERIVVASAAATTPDGGMISAGAFGGATGFVFAHAAKVDSLGSLKWSTTLGQVTSMWFQGVGATADGGCVLAGNTSLAGGNPASILAKLDSRGGVSWTKAVPGESSGMLALGHGNGFVFSGGYRGFSTYGSYIVKTDAAGSGLWMRYYEINQTITEFRSVTATSDGGLFFTGAIGTGSRSDLLLVKTDSLGQITWLKRYNSDFGEEDDAAFGIETPNGDYIVAGHTTTGINAPTNSILMRTDATGNIRWVREYRLDGSDVPAMVSVCSDGGFLVSGSTERSIRSGSEGYLIRTDDTGGVRWTRLIGGTAEAVLVSGTQRRDGGFLLAGASSGFAPVGTEAAWFLRTDSAGYSGCHERDTTIAAQAFRLYGFALPAPTSDNTMRLQTYGVTPGSGGQQYTLCSTVGISRQVGPPVISISPNPASTSIMIDAPGQHISRVVITDASGAVVREYNQAVAAKLSVEVSGLPAGIYFCAISLANRQILRTKFTVLR